LLVTESMTYVSLGERLRQRRLSRKLRQRDVARLVGVSQPTVSAWENGAVPDYAHLAGIANFLDLSQSQVGKLAHDGPGPSRDVAFGAEQAGQLDRVEQWQRQLMDELTAVRRDLFLLRAQMERISSAGSSSRRIRRPPSPRTR
jgi:transcriptional regulator with XRE-family HTH domain